MICAQQIPAKPVDAGKELMGGGPVPQGGFAGGEVVQGVESKRMILAVDPAAPLAELGLEPAGKLMISAPADRDGQIAERREGVGVMGLKQPETGLVDLVVDLPRGGVVTDVAVGNSDVVEQGEGVAMIGTIVRAQSLVGSPLELEGNVVVTG